MLAAFAVVSIVDKYFISDAGPLNLGQKLLGVGLFSTFIGLRYEGTRNSLYLQRSLVEQDLRRARRKFSLSVYPSRNAPQNKGLVAKPFNAQKIAK
jgi:hypothetical protein